MTPGKGRLDARLYDAEQALDGHSRKPPDGGRSGQSIYPRRGKHRAICTEQITHATPGAVRLVEKSGGVYIDAMTVVENVGGYILNTGESIEPRQAVLVEFLDDNTWEVVFGNCLVRNWLLDGEEE